MKKLLLAIFAIALPIMMHAQSEGLLVKKNIKARQELSYYAQKGLVPEIDGKIAFKDVIAAPGKNKSDIFRALSQWASLRYEPNTVRGFYTDENFFKNIEYSKVITADKNSGKFVCQGAEELIFSIKTLAKNYTQVYYTLTLTASDGKVDFELRNISYNVDQGESQFVRVVAEDWISDKECLNKKGELRKIPGKFRIRTIDLVTELKAEISAAIMAQ